jgi:hypothetical protein
VLTQVEFDAQKAKLLGDGASQQAATPAKARERANEDRREEARRREQQRRSNEAREDRKQSGRARTGNAAFAIGLFITGLVLILGAGLFIYRGKKSVLTEVETVNDKLEREIADLKKVIGEVDEYKALQERLEQKLGVIRRLKANKTLPGHMLDELALRVPNGLWITGLRQIDKKAVIEGISKNNEVLAHIHESPRGEQVLHRGLPRVHPSGEDRGGSQPQGLPPHLGAHRAGQRQ